MRSVAQLPYFDSNPFRGLFFFCHLGSALVCDVVVVHLSRVLFPCVWEGVVWGETNGGLWALADGVG